jgi:hypothetical protein
VEISDQNFVCITSSPSPVPRVLHPSCLSSPHSIYTNYEAPHYVIFSSSSSLLLSYGASNINVPFK